MGSKRRPRFIYIRRDQHDDLVKRDWNEKPSMPKINLSRLMQDTLDIALPITSESNPTRKTIYFAIMGQELRIFESEEEAIKNGKHA